MRENLLSIITEMIENNFKLIQIVVKLPVEDQKEMLPKIEASINEAGRLLKEARVLFN